METNENSKFGVQFTPKDKVVTDIEKLFFRISAKTFEKRITASTSAQCSYTALTQKQRIELAQRTEVLKQAKQEEINAAIASANYEALPVLMNELTALNVDVTSKVTVPVNTITGIDYIKTCKAVFEKYTVEELLQLFGEFWVQGSDVEKKVSLYLNFGINCKPAPKISEKAEEVAEEEENTDAEEEA
jgi:hypothetical protein